MKLETTTVAISQGAHCGLKILQIILQCVNTVCAVGLDVLKPSFMATVHKSCCCVHTLLNFSQKVRELFVIGHVFKLTLGVCNLWEVCVSDVLV